MPAKVIPQLLVSFERANLSQANQNYSLEIFVLEVDIRIKVHKTGLK